ncbi:TetR/AcrR family transcriptional regulator [Confluentibacter sediminis]|uniref:TetR/AcrR family transcriptional regulator n=1 Tax=Confluentibacter sediminis TaxID=2219045 RepID=UPI000DAF38D6|nr:TetR/AcrR family transcriptional regulator [Confluentibacter sediminis]
MISKSELLECSITNFTKFGSKSFTLDELASQMGMSKKTIYNYFKNKEDLVSESVGYLIKKIKNDMDSAVLQHTDPIVKIIEIYKIGFDYFKCFKPSFIFGLKKYYPKASEVFETFRNYIVYEKVYNLLLEAQSKRLFRDHVNLKLVCDLYFLRIDDIAYKKSNIFDVYSNKELLEHLIIHNLKGICSDSYSNAYFE